MSLVACVSIAITDFEVHFGRRPQVVTLPCWRYDELIRCFQFLQCEPADVGESQICGIPLRFSPQSNLIELE